MTVVQIVPYNKNFIVYFDLVDEIILSKDELDKFNIVEGCLLRKEVYTNIVNELLIPRAKNKALSYLSYRPRTSTEIKKYLSNKGFNDSIVENVMSFLIEYNYINDYRFAKSFIENKTNSKPFSRKGIYYHLINKGIKSDIIDEALQELEFDEEKCCITLINKRLKGKVLDKNEKNKLYRYLQGKGFCYSTIKKAISSYEN